MGLLGAACTLPTQAQDEEEEAKLNFSAGGGYNTDKDKSIVGQFMWDGLPPSVVVIGQLNGISPNVNLYNITADYKYRSGFANTFGYYVIAGGGWS